MDSFKIIGLFEYIKSFDKHNSSAISIALDEAIKSIKFSLRAEELLKACADLLDKQNKSPYVLNLLDELIYYDNCECDGNCLLEDIENLLEHRE